LILVGPPVIAWISGRFLPTTLPLPTNLALSWEKALGVHPPTLEPPVPAVVEPPLRVLTLPSVLSVEDALETTDGWVLLDRRMGKIHLLQNGSDSVRSVGREGEGPGELRDPVALALAGSHLWVLNQRGLVLDRFSPEGSFEARIRIHGGGCLVGLSKDLLALPDGQLLVLRVCPAALPGPGTAWIERVDSAGALSTFLVLPLGTPGSRRLNLFRQPAVDAAGPRVFLGTWDVPCVAELTRAGALTGHRCLPEFELAQAPEEGRATLRRRFGRLPDLGFLPLEVPDRLPWYDGFFKTDRGLVIRRIRGEESRDLVLLGSDGRTVATDRLFPEATFVGNRTILVANDLFQGTRVEIFPSPFR